MSNSELLACDPLTDEEAEAAFVALVEVLDGLGCVPAATVASKDDGGVSLSLHFSADRARKLVAATRTQLDELRAENERLREALQNAALAMTCRREDDAHYCPNCDNSLYEARDEARKALGGTNANPV